MTIVYYTYCTQLPHLEFTKAVSLLPLYMQKKLLKFRRWQDAHAYLYGRLLLKEGLLEFGFNSSLELMRKGEFGKPYFEDADFSFNISHSGDYIVCVISSDEKENIGIDIEKISLIDLDDFSSVLSPREKSLVDSNEKFYNYWTRKEAIIKADGRGLLIPLDTLETIDLSVALGEQQYFLKKINIDREYKAHIASLKKIEMTETKKCQFFAEQKENPLEMVMV